MADLLYLLVVEHAYRVTVGSSERLAGPRPGATTQENCGGRDSARGCSASQCTSRSGWPSYWKNGQINASLATNA